MIHSFRLHLDILSLPDTIDEVENFGVERSQKANLRSASCTGLNQIAIDETVIHIVG